MAADMENFAHIKKDSLDHTRAPPLHHFAITPQTFAPLSAL